MRRGRGGRKSPLESGGPPGGRHHLDEYRDHHYCHHVRMLPHFPARCHCHWSVQSSSLYLVLGKEKDFRYMNVIISTIIINIIIQFQDIRHFIFSLNHQQCQTECSILKSCFWSFQRLYIHEFNFSH